jgi:hypothetical protein
MKTQTRGSPASLLPWATRAADKSRPGSHTSSATSSPAVAGRLRRAKPAWSRRRQDLFLLCVSGGLLAGWGNRGWRRLQLGTG